MSEQINHIETKVANFADEVQQHFVRVGEDAKQQVLTNFKSALENDVDHLKAVVGKAVSDDVDNIKNNLHQSLNQSVEQSFGSSILGSLLNNLVLPSVFNLISGKKIDIDSPQFREAAGQTLVDIGNTIARSSVDKK